MNLITDISKLNFSYPEEVNNLGVGATTYFVGSTPTFIGQHQDLKMREETRNSYLGYTVSRPEEDIYVFGLAYEDRKDGNQHDEDYFVHNTRDRIITRYYGKKLETIDSRYVDTHHKYQQHLITK